MHPLKVNRDISWIHEQNNGKKPLISMGEFQYAFLQMLCLCYLPQTNDKQQNTKGKTTIIMSGFQYKFVTKCEVITLKTDDKNEFTYLYIVYQQR